MMPHMEWAWEIWVNGNKELPCIIHLRQNHFVALYGAMGSCERKAFVSAPAIGLLAHNKNALLGYG